MTIASEKVAEFMLCQYMGDTVRREPRNIGVIVVRDSEVACRFLGESQTGIDGRSLKFIRELDAYKQWVVYWKRLIAKNDPELSKRLLSSGKRNYYIIPGGSLAGTEADDLNYVCEYLYSTLVSNGGVDELDEDLNSIKSSKSLEGLVAAVFRDANILGDSSRMNAPVYRDKDLMGANHFHRFAFVQTNGVVRGMEVFDFNTVKSKQLKYHAAWAKVAFDEVKKAMGQHSDVDMVSIVQPAQRPEFKETEQYCIDMLQESCGIYDWSNQRERESLVIKCTKSAGALEI